ncbi:MAG: hypothetical protein NUV53_01880 [Patescibacteria group bacterium]|nr:hypothetical protein [Patescibacteria group bacterium]
MSHGGGGGKSGVWGLLGFVLFIGLVIFAFVRFPPPTNFRFGETSSSTANRAGTVPVVIKQSSQAVGSSRNSGATANTGTQASSGSGVSPQEIPKGFTAEQLSPYFHKVRLGSVYTGGGTGGGQITLSAYLTGSDTVMVTGWRIEGMRGGSVYVPQAVKVYDAQGLAPETDIVMKSGDALYLYASGQSAIGKNLRINKCLAYLPTIANFKPSIPNSCPYINRSEISNFSGQCQNYILSLGCRAPDMSDIRVPRNEDACRDFLQTLNYQGCLTRHAQDKDFLQNQIYTWISSISLDPFHDQAKLLDGNGLLVDVYEY